MLLSAITSGNDDYKEWVLRPDSSVYVLGQTGSGGLIGAPAKGTRQKTFVITHKSKDEYASSLTSSMKWLLGAEIVFYAAAAGCFVCAFVMGSG
jgi:hypothetical protein